MIGVLIILQISHNCVPDLICSDIGTFRNYRPSIRNGYWRDLLRSAHLHWDGITNNYFRGFKIYCHAGALGQNKFLPKRLQTIFLMAVSAIFGFNAFSKGEIKIFQCGRSSGHWQSSVLILGKGFLFLYGFKDGRLAFLQAFKLCFKLQLWHNLAPQSKFPVRSFRIGNKGQGTILVPTRHVFLMPITGSWCFCAIRKWDSWVYI